jgi:hypothetical protein
MGDRFAIRLDDSVSPVRFVLESPGGVGVAVDEILVTELGSEEPIWRVVVDDYGFASELVDAGILTRTEAASPPVLRAPRGPATGAAVSSFRLGETPAGMREIDPKKPLVPGRLYELTVSGESTESFEFRG